MKKAELVKAVAEICYGQTKKSATKAGSKFWAKDFSEHSGLDLEWFLAQAEATLEDFCLTYQSLNMRDSPMDDVFRENIWIMPLSSKTKMRVSDIVKVSKNNEL